MSAEEFPDNQKPKEEKKMAEKKEPNNKKGGALDKQGHDLADSFQVEIKTAKKLLKEGKTDQAIEHVLSSFKEFLAQVGKKEKISIEQEKSLPDLFYTEIEAAKKLHEEDPSRAIEHLKKSFAKFNTIREYLGGNGRPEDHIECEYYDTFRDAGDIESAYNVIDNMRVTPHNENQASIRERIDDLIRRIDKLLKQPSLDAEDSAKYETIKESLNEKFLELDDIDLKTEKVDHVTDTKSFENQLNWAKENPEKEEEVAEALKQLETYLQDVREGRVDKKKRLDEDGNWKDGGRWIDHREGELFEYYLGIKDEEGTRRIIESMQDTSHNTDRHPNIKKDRIKAWEKVFDEKFDDVE